MRVEKEEDGCSGGRSQKDAGDELGGAEAAGFGVRREEKCGDGEGDDDGGGLDFGGQSGEEHGENDVLAGGQPECEGEEKDWKKFEACALAGGDEGFGKAEKGDVAEGEVCAVTEVSAGASQKDQREENEGCADEGAGKCESQRCGA